MTAGHGSSHHRKTQSVYPYRIAARLLTYHGEPIGTAIRKTPKSKYNYYINPKLFALYAGLTMDELRRAVAEMKGEAA